MDNPLPRLLSRRRPGAARRLAAVLCLAAAAGAAAQPARAPAAPSLPASFGASQTPSAGLPAPQQPVQRPAAPSTPVAMAALAPLQRAPIASTAQIAPAQGLPPAAVPAARADAAAAPAAPVISLSSPAAAAPAAPGTLPAALEQQVRQLAVDGTRSLAAPAAGGTAPPLRVEVLVGALDPRLRLAPCERIEAFLGAGTRLWGATRVGLRCVQGPARWSVYVPVTVNIHGRALVATSALPVGSVLTAADLALADVDLAADPSAALVDATLAAGRTLQRALAAGQSLRQSHLKPRQWFAAGDTVQVLANGDGFRVSGEAVALTRGVEGEAARVRTDSGRVLTGMPAAERRIELPL